jgi:hypothetical protein
MPVEGVGEPQRRHQGRRCAARSCIAPAQPPAAAQFEIDGAVARRARIRSVGDGHARHRLRGHGRGPAVAALPGGRREALLPRHAGQDRAGGDGTSASGKGRRRRRGIRPGSAHRAGSRPPATTSARRACRRARARVRTGVHARRSGMPNGHRRWWRRPVRRRCRRERPASCQCSAASPRERKPASMLREREGSSARFKPALPSGR